MATLVTKLGASFTDTSLPSLQRDEVIVNGTLFAMDLERSYSWAGGDPVDTDTVYDLTRNDRHATMVIGSGSISNAGGGFDFTNGPNSGGACIKVPTSVFAALWGTSQYFLCCLYMKLPTLANWNPSNNAKVFFDSAGNSDFTSAAALCSFGQALNGLVAYRKKTSTTYDGLLVSAANLTNFYDTVCQVALWRDASTISMRVKNGVDAKTSSIGSGSANDTSFASTYGEIGIVEGANLHPSGNQKKFRAYRFFLEDLEISGRTATTVLDDDWDRTADRAVFS